MTKSALLIVLLLITVYSRFINLNWDFGWGFHPDENNLWGASRRVDLFSKLDPEFYAYGGFPIYLYSLLGSKVEARAVSAGAQVLIVILLFIIGRRIAGFKGGFFAAAMGTFSAGLVQAGHFLTVESLFGLLSLTMIWCLLNYQELLKVLADRASSSVMSANFWLIMAAVVLGLGVGTKVSFAAFAIPLLLIVLRSNLWFPKVRPLYLGKAGPFQTIKALASSVLPLLIAALIFFLTNPFIFSKWNEVKSTLEYEAKVATGSLSVFYTRQFLDTTGGWFQAVHVFPYITGWLFLPMFLIGAFVVCFKGSPWRPPLLPTRLLRELFVHGSWSAFRRVNTPRRVLIISMLAALLSFLPFWAKWTRYVVQVLPILILVAGIGAGWIWEKGKTGKAIVVAAMISFLPQFFSTLSVYANEDTRVAAAKWAEQNISKDAKIFTETMDLGILPFNPTFGQNIKLFNFYELDSPSEALAKEGELNSLIDESDYFILLSRRVYKNSLDHSDKFPRAAKFYQRLFDGSIGYKQFYPPSQKTTGLPVDECEKKLRRMSPPYNAADNPPKPWRRRVSWGTTALVVGLHPPRRNNCSLFTVYCSLFFAPEETFEVFDNPHLMIFQRKL